VVALFQLIGQNLSLPIWCGFAFSGSSAFVERDREAFERLGYALLGREQRHRRVSHRLLLGAVPPAGAAGSLIPPDAPLALGGTQTHRLHCGKPTL